MGQVKMSENVPNGSEIDKNTLDTILLVNLNGPEVKKTQATLRERGFNVNVASSEGEIQENLTRGDITAIVSIISPDTTNDQLASVYSSLPSVDRPIPSYLFLPEGQQTKWIRSVADWLPMGLGNLIRAPRMVEKGTLGIEKLVDSINHDLRRDKQADSKGPHRFYMSLAAQLQPDDPVGQYLRQTRNLDAQSMGLLAAMALERVRQGDLTYARILGPSRNLVLGITEGPIVKAFNNESALETERRYFEHFGKVNELRAGFLTKSQRTHEENYINLPTVHKVLSLSDYNILIKEAIHGVLLYERLLTHELHINDFVAATVQTARMHEEGFHASGELRLKDPVVSDEYMNRKGETEKGKNKYTDGISTYHTNRLEDVLLGQIEEFRGIEIDPETRAMIIGNWGVAINDSLNNAQPDLARAKIDAGARSWVVRSRGNYSKATGFDLENDIILVPQLDLVSLLEYLPKLKPDQINFLLDRYLLESARANAVIYGESAYVADIDTFSGRMNNPGGYRVGTFLDLISGGKGVGVGKEKRAYFKRVYAISSPQKHLEWAGHKIKYAWEVQQQLRDFPPEPERASFLDIELRNNQSEAKLHLEAAIASIERLYHPASRFGISQDQRKALTQVNEGLTRLQNRLYSPN